MDDKGFQNMVVVVTTLLSNLVMTVINTVMLPISLVMGLFTPDGEGGWETKV